MMAEVPKYLNADFELSTLLTEEMHQVRGESYFTPIVTAINTVGEEKRGRLQKKFDISYFIA